MISRRRQRRARAEWARSEPAEHVRAGLAADPDETLREVRALVDEDPPGVGAEGWYMIWSGRGERQTSSCRRSVSVALAHMPPMTGSSSELQNAHDR